MIQEALMSSAPLLDPNTDSLASLEQRIQRAVESLAALRKEKESLTRLLEAAQAERDQARAENRKLAVDKLRAERSQVRERIERLLGQMDELAG
jgi:FtsZ-binding cell division protein ZapB